MEYKFQYLLYQLITSGLKRACDSLTFALAFPKKKKKGDFKFRLEQVGGACGIIIKDHVVHSATHGICISDMVVFFPDQTRLSLSCTCMSCPCACMWLLIITCNIGMCMCVYLRETHSLVWSACLICTCVWHANVSPACECAVICMLFPAQTLCGNSQPSNWVTLGYFLKC